jgi:hypothetical protein
VHLQSFEEGGSLQNNQKKTMVSVIAVAFGAMYLRREGNIIISTPEYHHVCSTPKTAQ